MMAASPPNYDGCIVIGNGITEIIRDYIEKNGKTLHKLMDHRPGSGAKISRCNQRCESAQYNFSISQHTALMILNYQVLSIKGLRSSRSR